MKASEKLEKYKIQVRLFSPSVFLIFIWLPLSPLQLRKFFEASSRYKKNSRNVELIHVNLRFLWRFFMSALNFVVIVIRDASVHDDKILRTIWLRFL